MGEPTREERPNALATWAGNARAEDLEQVDAGGSGRLNHNPYFLWVMMKIMAYEKKTTVELDADSAEALAFLKELYGSQTEAFRRALARERAHADRMVAYRQFIEEFDVSEEELNEGRRWWAAQQATTSKEPAAS